MNANLPLTRRWSTGSKDPLQCNCVTEQADALYLSTHSVFLRLERQRSVHTLFLLLRSQFSCVNNSQSDYRMEFGSNAIAPSKNMPPLICKLSSTQQLRFSLLSIFYAKFSGNTSSLVIGRFRSILLAFIVARDVGCYHNYD